MSPGVYLRLRREAAGLSIDDVALLVCDHASWVAFTAAGIRFLEADQSAFSPAFAMVLRGAFPFDLYVLRQLVSSITPAPDICGRCGCSALDACDDEIAGACAWASPARDLCTHCASNPARAITEETSHA